MPRLGIAKSPVAGAPASWNPLHPFCPHLGSAHLHKALHQQEQELHLALLPLPAHLHKALHQQAPELHLSLLPLPAGLQQLMLPAVLQQVQEHLQALLKVHFKLYLAVQFLHPTYLALLLALPLAQPPLEPQTRQRPNPLHPLLPLHTPQGPLRNSLHSLHSLAQQQVQHPYHHAMAHQEAISLVAQVHPHLPHQAPGRLQPH